MIRTQNARVAPGFRTFKKVAMGISQICEREAQTHRGIERLPVAASLRASRKVPYVAVLCSPDGSAQPFQTK